MRPISTNLLLLLLLLLFVYLSEPESELTTERWRNTLENEV